MATLQTISHGEPNWDVKVNSIIDAVNGQNNTINNLKPSSITTDGLVFQNGFSLRSDGYQTITLPSGQKIVFLNLALKLDADSSQDSVHAVTVPDVFKKGIAYRHSEAGWGTYWSSDGYGTITIGKESGYTGKLKGGENSYYFVSTEFIA